MTWAAKVSNLFLKVQVDAGADAVQLFDSGRIPLPKQLCQPRPPVFKNDIGGRCWPAHSLWN